MPDSALSQAALVAVFRRRKLAGTITAEQLEAHVDSALAAMSAGTTIVELQFEGGGSTAVVNCNPPILLSAANQVLEETADDAVAGTGAIDMDFSQRRIET